MRSAFKVGQASRLSGPRRERGPVADSGLVWAGYLAHPAASAAGGRGRRVGAGEDIRWNRLAAGPSAGKRRAQDPYDS